MGSVKDEPHTDGGGSNGHSLEIFLFSNGQRDTPPRIYNVRLDDRWDTLNFLARSQNGSNHTIELYTTDGTKIDRALELSNGAAYVAVEPPQQFIPSGYNDYLMKASRSREKRQEKLPESNLLIKPDTTKSKPKTEELNKDGTNIKIIQDITIRPNSRTAVKEQDAITKKVKADVAKSAKPIGRLSNKQNQKKDNQLPLPNSHTDRKNSSNVSPSVKRKLIRSNYRPPNPSTNTMSTKGDATGVITVIKNNQNGPEAPEAYDLLKNVDTAGESFSSVPSYTATKSLTVLSTITEQIIILPVPPEEDVRESKHAINSLSNLNNSILIIKHSDAVLDQNVKLVPDKLTSSPSPLTENPIETDRVQTKTPELINVTNNSRKKSVIFGKQTGDNNFTIYVNRNDIENLKIEIKNVSSSTLLAQCNHVVKSTTEFDGTAPRDEAKNDREVPALTELWYGGHQHGQLTCNPRAVCRSDCCSYSRTEGPGVGPVYVDNNNYFILLPPEEFNEQLLSCACKLTADPEATHETPYSHEFPIRRHTIKLNGDERVPRNTKTIIDKIVQNTIKKIHDPTIAKDEALTFNGTAEEDTVECDCSPCSCLVQFPSPSCSRHNQNLSLGEYPHRDQEQATDYVIDKETALTYKDPTMFKNALTQTDWSGIVLESRPRENGGYEFCIPPLSVLKDNKSLY